ncbi:14657_t:CDS:2 [Funneliformis mosseae]|uniref:14657_t:CDS:1 n=1 Tax=Funneliformis mosseae TaxID=27381 RepID=A0A9N8ZZV8_FUNMO|nr:14657_t:CDS:2 [Funneliformis mosseae]
MSAQDQLLTNKGSEVHLCEQPLARVITKKKRSIIGEQYYEEFSMEFWKELDICFSGVYFSKSKIFFLKHLLFLESQRSMTSSNTTIQLTLLTPDPLKTNSDTSSFSHK